MKALRWLRRDPELDCRAVGVLVQSFLDDELDERRAMLVAAHLDRCRDCGLEEETLRAVKAAVARRRVPTDANVRARLARFADELVEDAGQS